MTIRNVKKVQNRVAIKTAFISVYDKTYVEQLVDQLFTICPGLTVLSSGGTYTYLKEKLLGEDYVDRIIEVSEYTGMPETDGGLVKTLHHKLFLGYLTETYSEAHRADLRREAAMPIDLVIVDLYPFEQVIAKSGCTLEDARGNIDVGGPSALRAAAKNFLRVMTVGKYSPQAYENLIHEINSNRGHTTLEARFEAMKETFTTLSKYDSKVVEYLNMNIGYLTPKDFKELYEIV